MAHFRDSSNMLALAVPSATGAAAGAAAAAGAEAFAAAVVASAETATVVFGLTSPVGGGCSMRRSQSFFWFEREKETMEHARSVRERANEERRRKELIGKRRQELFFDGVGPTDFEKTSGDEKYGVDDAFFKVLASSRLLISFFPLYSRAQRRPTSHRSATKQNENAEGDMLETRHEIIV